MSTRQRAERFAQYVGLELKGAIIARGFTAKQVAEATNRSPAAFNRWINGKAELPMVALSESCEIIGMEPDAIVENAYARMVMDFGEIDGLRYDEPGEVIEFPDYSQMSDEDVTNYGLAANEGDPQIGPSDSPHES